MDAMTINITDKNSIDLLCSKCGSAKRINISQMPNGIGRAYKITCKCTHSFTILFNRRKHRRKRCSLIATYSVKNVFGDNIITITNLSRGGLAFNRSDNNQLKINDRITIRFNLDNAQGDLIESTAIIRNILQDTVYVQFEEMRGRMQTTLGFYFL
ncbi:hypothetical protein SBDP1_40007 [Syntrophobacter sp. SbD1]|nr:hypothetical protein SBDP1_40007 [Syntrophobacter sp. SbD1]